MKEVTAQSFQPIDDAEIIGMGETFNTFTPLETQVLTGLNAMITRSLDIRNDLRDSTPKIFGGIDDKGKVVEKYFDIDGRLLFFVNKMIMNRHKFYIEGNPKMEEAARDIRNTLYNQAEESSLSPTQLTELWDVT